MCRVKELESDQEYVCHVSRLTNYRSGHSAHTELEREWARRDREDDAPVEMSSNGDRADRIQSQVDTRSAEAGYGHNDEHDEQNQSQGLSNKENDDRLAVGNEKREKPRRAQ